jgi:hypothetical protein
MKYPVIAAICFTLAFACWGAAIHMSRRAVHAGEFSWAIQGELSHRNCDTQPGTHPWYIENEGMSWFMGCEHAAPDPLPAILPGNDPDAPPLDPDTLTVLRRFGLPVPQSTTEWKRFDTLHGAAMYAALRLEGCSHYYECSGYIAVDPKGKFTVSPVRTDYSSDSVSIEDGDAPSDWKVVADFHSHPCVPHHYTGLFSGEDMIGALMTRHTAYMVDLCTGEVHEFIPGTSKVDVEPIHDGEEYLSPGNIIGHVPAFAYAALAHEGL